MTRTRNFGGLGGLFLMIISAEQITHDLKVLRHGGAEAVVLFMDLARRCFEQGGPSSMAHWVALALPALPEADRNVTMTLLLRALYGDYDMEAATQEEHRTLH